MKGTAAGKPRRELVRRVAQLVSAGLVGVVLVGSTSGCAVAARLLMAAEAIDTLHDLAEDFPVDPRPPVRTAAIGPTAVVSGTHGDGLRLNARPGQDRLLTVPEGTSVAVLCDNTGPEVTGSARTSSTWTYVRTADGSTGFMSNAYLDVDPGGPTVPRC